MLIDRDGAARDTTRIEGAAAPGARGAAFVMLLGVMVAAAPVPAAPVPTSGAPQSPEYLIKAAYLYDFAMFVECPSNAFATADAPVVIGVVGADPFGSALDSTVQDKRINKRRLTIERLQWNQDFTHCHILFIGSSDKARTGEVTQRLDRLPVLTVGDAPDRGATISFTVDDNRVRFEINQDSAKRARLVIGARLLKLATHVRGS